MYRRGNLLIPFLLIVGTPFLFATHLFAETASEFAQMAEAAYAKRDYRSAVYYFKKSLEKNSSYVRSLIGSGNSYLLIGDTDRAEEYFGKALRLEERNTEAMTGLGRACTANGKFKEAYAYLNRAIEMDPGSVAANFSLGEYHLAIGKLLPAEGYFKKVLRLRPDHQSALIALCRIETDRGRTVEADRYFTRAREIDSSHFDLHAARSLLDLKKALLTNDEFDREEHLNLARESALIALQLSPMDISLQKMVIGIDLMQNRIEEARSKADELRRNFDGDSEIAYLSAAMHSAYSGDPKIISELYEKAMRSDPSNSLIRFAYEEFVLSKESDFFPAGGVRRDLAGHHYRLYEHYLKSGRSLSAKFHLLRSLDLFPEDERASVERLERHRIDGDYESYIMELGALSGRNPENRSLRFRLENTLNDKKKILSYRERLFSPDVNPESATYIRTPNTLFVFDLEPERDSFSYPDASIQISRSINAYLSVPGRVKPVSKGFRDSVMNTIRIAEKSGMKDILFGTRYRPHYIPYIEQMERETTRVRFIVYGSYLLTPGGISVSLKIIDKKSSRTVDEFRIAASGSDALHEIAMSAAERINRLPITGRIVKTGHSGIFINLGSVDGIKRDQIFTLHGPEKKGVRKIRVIETDYYISRAEPVDSEWTEFAQDETVTPE